MLLSLCIHAFMIFLCFTDLVKVTYVFNIFILFLNAGPADNLFDELRDFSISDYALGLLLSDLSISKCALSNDTAFLVAGSLAVKTFVDS